MSVSTVSCRCLKNVCLFDYELYFSFVLNPIALTLGLLWLNKTAARPNARATLGYLIFKPLMHADEGKFKCIYAKVAPSHNCKLYSEYCIVYYSRLSRNDLNWKGG